MSEFRRNLLKMGGVMNVEQYVRRHLLCWYSPKRQGATNESLAADPRLVDLSGKGNDLILEGMTYTESNGVASDGCIVFRNSRGVCQSNIVLRNFTVICKRRLDLANYTSYPCVAHKGASRDDKAFAMEWVRGDVCCVSFGQYNKISLLSKGVVFMTSSSYNGIKSLERGTYNDKATDKLIISGDGSSGLSRFSLYLYDFMLFNVSLSAEQIQWVVDNFINE